MEFVLKQKWFSCSFLLCRPGRESDSEAEDIEHAEKLRQVKAVLEEVNTIFLNYTSANMQYRKLV